MRQSAMGACRPYPEPALVASADFVEVVLRHTEQPGDLPVAPRRAWWRFADQHGGEVR
jgi:hypothetical protein